MRIDITSLCFGFKIEKDNDSGTAAWATSIGQAPKGICFIDTNRDGLDEIVYGMMYKSHSDFENLKVRDIEGLEKREEPRGDRERMLFSVFDNVYVNNKKVEGIYTLSYEREDSSSHKNRLHICYAKYLTYKGHSNKETLKEMAKVLGCNEDACWFVTDISIKNQKDLHFTAVVVNPTSTMSYTDSKVRKKAWENLMGEIMEPDSAVESLSFQQIFYGAPGTGKSHTINEITEKQPEKNVFRTTFHPDSDYSTFVGCYKPSMKRPEKIYTEKELTAKLKEIKESGVTYPCHKFATKYWESLKDLDTQSIKNILSACGFTDSMAVEVSKGIAIGQEFLNVTNDGKIVYNFSPQAFTKAYLRAWQIEDPVYLVIEEINRGNCAQIFGDLFQLLDRKNGFSEYPIKADNDLAAYIGEQLSKESRESIPETVKTGEELILPPNLYIWATMNTSDQSLFPIDSAFKRRWEWKYLKIKDHPDQHYRIKLNDEVEYDWYAFIKKINQIIASMTSSADKQLGYFFCKADGDGIIKADTFVAKVIFYLWNDVFKDYGFEDASLFTFTEIVDGKEETRELTFPDFYDEDGEKVNIKRITEFIKNVMNWKKTTEESR